MRQIHRAQAGVDGVPGGHAWARGRAEGNRQQRVGSTSVRVQVQGKEGMAEGVRGEMGGGGWVEDVGPDSFALAS